MHPLPRLLTALAMAAASAASLAAPVVYTSSATFLAQLQPGAYTEGFNGLAEAPPVDFSNGTYAYSLSAPSDLYSDGEFIGTNQIDEALTISFTSGNVKAIGGNFFATNISNDFQAVLISLLLSDGSTESFTPATLADSYRGFVSDSFITSLVISGPGASLYASLDNLTVGTLAAATVPEPASLALVGLAIAGLVVTRRRAA